MQILVPAASVTETRSIGILIFFIFCCYIGRAALTRGPLQRRLASFFELLLSGLAATWRA
jgi:hypothetical protein